jgi:hypothetical protein
MAVTPFFGKAQKVARQAHEAAAEANASAAIATTSAMQAQVAAQAAQESAEQAAASALDATANTETRGRLKERISIVALAELALLVPLVLVDAFHLHWYVNPRNGDINLVKLLNVNGSAVVALGAMLAMLVEIDQVRRWLRAGAQGSLLVLPFLFLAAGAGLLFIAAYIS